MLKKISDIHVPLAHSLSDRHAHGNKEPLHPICLSLSRPVHSSPPTRASVTNEQTRNSVPKSVPEFFPHSFVEEKGRGGEALHYNQLGPLWVIIPLVFFRVVFILELENSQGQGDMLQLSNFTAISFSEESRRHTFKKSS